MPDFFSMMPSSNISREAYTVKLNQILNTYYTSINGVLSLSGGLSKGKFDVPVYSRIKFAISESSNGTRSTKDVVIECHEG